MENVRRWDFGKLILVLISLVALVSAGYFYWQWRMLKENPQAVAQAEAEELVIKVGKLLILPEGEVPTVATVSDPEALKNQPFFTKAEKGDKVLIYTEANKAVLYSVRLNKIIDVAQLNIGNQETGGATGTSTLE